MQMALIETALPHTIRGHHRAVKSMLGGLHLPLGDVRLGLHTDPQNSVIAAFCGLILILFT